MILGIDTSAILESRNAGAHYFVNNQEVDPLVYLHDRNGVSILRLRLWLDPYTEEGHPYGGGTVDLPAFIKMAKEGLAKDYQILLDFHYSDFWCDPAKQWIPKAWAGLTLDEVAAKVYAYTRDTLLTLQEEGISLYGIQIGNEITNGTLWPLAKLTPSSSGGKREGYPALIKVLQHGVKASREVCPESKIVIHLERSYDQYIYQEFFDELVAAKLDFDVIGMSYYPYWHGTFKMLFGNVDMLRERYHKPIWIVETAYGFTTEAAHHEGETFIPLVNDTFLAQPNIHKPFPLTLEGQRVFTHELLRLAKLHEVEAIFWWEPLWYPLKGLKWATDEGEAYAHETDRPTNNEWGNQCLFNYQGHDNPALFEYKV